MRMQGLVRAIALWCALAGVARAAERVEAGVASRADATQTYALFVPADASPHSPLLVVLDPRGRGRAMLDLALPHARERGWVVLSSDGSRSDTDEAVTGRALGALMQELDRYPHDARRVYLAGMSGTAKTLWVVAPKLRGRIAGFIAAGGARPPELPPLRKDDALPWFGYAGTTDFNHREMLAMDATLQALGTPHRLVLFDGPHGWPPDLHAAMAWMDLQAMRGGLAARDAGWIDAQSVACAKDADAARDALEHMRRLDACIRDFDGLRDVAAWRTQRAALANDADVHRLQALDDRLATEERRYRRRVDEWRIRFGRRFVETVEQPPMALADSLRMLQVASLRKQARDPEPRVVDSAKRRLAWVHAAAAFYLPEFFRSHGDDRRVEALRDVAAATAPD